MTKHIIDVYWNGVIEYIEENSDDIPEESGVYEILVKNDDGKYYRKYIGQSDNLNDRYFSHMSNQEKNEDIKNGLKKYHCGFDYALLDPEDDRKDAEQKLYDEHGYSWNKQRPEGSGRNSDIEVVEHDSQEE